MSDSLDAYFDELATKPRDAIDILETSQQRCIRELVTKCEQINEKCFEITVFEPHNPDHAACHEGMHEDDLDNVDRTYVYRVDTKDKIVYSRGCCGCGKDVCPWTTVETDQYCSDCENHAHPAGYGL